MTQRNQMAEMLGSLPFLEGAKPHVLALLAQRATEERVQAGETIVEEGATGREMYLIVEGSVEVVKRIGTEETAAQPIARRGPGEFFGEMAILEERPRSATVRALEPTHLLVFSEDTMRSTLAQQPELLFRTVQILSKRLRQSDSQMITDLQRKNEELARAYEELKQAQVALVEKERLERELELAREIQQSILPQEFPHLPGFDCMARSRPARQVGGDFYDVIHLGEDRVGLVMADVSDKGMPAALFMALARSLIRAEAQRSPSPQAVLQNAHRLLLEMNRAGLFVTVFYGVIDLKSGTLRYVRAGHDKPLYYYPPTGTCRYLESKGMLLGLVDPVQFEEVCLDLKPGTFLILYTDGITDTRSPGGEFFGSERLLETVHEAGDRRAAALCDLVFQRVARFQAGATQYDDSALLVARVGPGG
ncbi:MAG: SpoIIE family protein phosphatase [Anaerolineae bacterium]